MTEDSVKKIDVNEFITEGYLQEANRQFFHPLGMALVADISNNCLTIWDKREDEEGIYYDYENSNVDRKKKFREKKKNVLQKFKERKDVRMERLGFIVEPIN